MSAPSRNPKASDRFWAWGPLSPWTIGALAILAWGAIFLAPEAKFWDDWVAFNDDTIRLTSELGTPWTGYIFNAVAALGPWAFKVSTLACTIVVGVTIYAISGRGFDLTRAERWLLGALVVAIPLFTVRMLASVNTYSWSLAIFMIAWYLLVRKPASERGVGEHIAAALLLFVSYTTGSLLVLTLIPVAHLAFLEIPRTGSFIRNSLRFAARFWFVLAAPIVFWILRTAFFTPYGLYENYNSFAIFRPPFTPITMGAFAMIALFIGAAGVLIFQRFAKVTLWARNSVSLCGAALGVAAVGGFLLITRVSTAGTARVVPYALLICAGVLGTIALRDFVVGARGRDQGPLRLPVASLVSIGVATFAVGILPYLLVGKLPTFENWETRHQLLLPLGCALIVLGAIRAVNSFDLRLVSRVCAITLVTIFTATSLLHSLALVADWNKQMQVASALAESELVEDASTVVFVDTTSRFALDGRGYAFYELNGWLITAFGDQTRLGLNKDEVGWFLDGSIDGLEYAASRYGYRDYKPSTDAVLVEIDAVPGASWLGLLLNQPTVVVTIIQVDDVSSLR